MKKARWWLAGFLIAAAFGSAFGQDYRTFQDELTEIRDRARLRVGPLKFIPELLRLRNLGYDDNVFFRAPSEHPVGDYTGTISPLVRSYLVVGHSLILSFTENPEYSYFARQSSLRTFTNSIASGFRLHVLSRFTFSGEYHQYRQLRRAYAEFTDLVTDTNRGESGSIFYETPRGTSIGFTATVNRYAYEDIVLPAFSILYSQTLNRRETTREVQFYYPVFSESAFFVRGGTTRYAFTAPSAQWRNAHSLQVSAGLRFPFTGRARGTLSLGYKRFKPEAEGRKSFSGLIADTSLNFRLSRFSLRLGLTRDNEFSYLENAYFYVENQARAGISFRLTRRFRLDYDWQSSGLRYSEPIPIIDPVAGPTEIMRRDTTRTHSIGFTILFLRKTGIQLSYNIFEWNSNMPGFSRDRNFFGLSLTQDF